MLKRILHRLRRTPRWKKTKFSRLKKGDLIRAKIANDQHKTEGIVIEVKPNYLWLKRDNRHLSISNSFTDIEIFK